MYELTISFSVENVEQLGLLSDKATELALSWGFAFNSAGSMCGERDMEFTIEEEPDHEMKITIHRDLVTALPSINSISLCRAMMDEELDAI